MTKLTAYATDDKHFLAPDMGHRALRDLNEHSEYRFLKGEAQVLWRDDIFSVFRSRAIWSKALVRCIRLDGREDDRQTDVHSFGGVRQ